MTPEAGISVGACFHEWPKKVWIPVIISPLGKDGIEISDEVGEISPHEHETGQQTVTSSGKQDNTSEK
jgi:hypothetical protein